MPLLRMMVFVDGENLLHRFEAMNDGERDLGPNTHWQPGEFVWNREAVMRSAYVVLRTTYYTAIRGSHEKVEEVRRKIRKLQFETGAIGGYTPNFVTPVVFKKEDQHEKTKAVDIQMTVDVLHHIYEGNVDAVGLITGDGDFLPVIDQAIRQGKHVFLGALSDGLNDQLPVKADYFRDLDLVFFKAPGNQ